MKQCLGINISTLGNQTSVNQLQTKFFLIPLTRIPRKRFTCRQNGGLRPPFQLSYTTVHGEKERRPCFFMPLLQSIFPMQTDKNTSSNVIHNGILIKCALKRYVYPSYICDVVFYVKLTKELSLPYP